VETQANQPAVHKLLEEIVFWDAFGQPGNA